jgi:hypothetical protein
MNFAENLGSNLTIVFGRGPLLLDSGGRGTAVDVKFQTPFFYNPSDGNLLLEVKNYEPISGSYPQERIGALDAYNVAGDEISQVFIYDVNAAGGSADTLGLTTYFVTAPKLAITRQSTNVVLRWTRDLGQFRLQQTPVLGPNASWEPLGNTYTYTVSAGYVIATLPVAREAPQRFFRLAWEGAAGP